MVHRNLNYEILESGDAGEGCGGKCHIMIDLWLEMSFEMKRIDFEVILA